MDNRSLNRALSFGWTPATALKKVMERIDDPLDRAAASLVCREWCRIDSKTRKHVTIALCYSAAPYALRRRFPDIESIKLKGKPRASMFYNLIPEDWGGYAAPWVAELADHFACLKYVHFRRMIVNDADVAVLVKARGDRLKELKLDKCSGFSTDSLMLIARICKDLRILFLEESTIIDKGDGEWLHELAVNNSVLETLNFYTTEITISWKDLELLATNCRALTSLKISDCDISNLVGVFRAAMALEEFFGGSFSDQVEASEYAKVCFPPRICCLGLSFLGTDEMHIVFPFAAALKKLDLQCAVLNTEDHCQLIQHCPNLEILEVRDVIGDRGLEVVAQTCRRMRRLRIERGEDEHGLEDEQGNVTQRGLSALAQGCLELEYLAVYVSDINNAALVSIGTFSKNLCDFRLVLLEREARITELPLDNGVRALLMGCIKLRRFGFYLRPGALTDVGLGYIGQFSSNVTYMLLSCVGESDRGLLQFSMGCPNLQKLEIRGCCFSESALALAVMNLSSLRYIWVEGYNASPTGSDLMLMAHPFWNIEFIPARQEILNNENGDGQPVGIMHPAQVLAYYSLAGRRTDLPETVVPLYPE